MDKKLWEPTPCECGHSWHWHAEFDDTLDRFVTDGCDHWSGCICEQFKEKKSVDIGTELPS